MHPESPSSRDDSIGQGFVNSSVLASAGWHAIEGLLDNAPDRPEIRTELTIVGLDGGYSGGSISLRGVPNRTSR